MGLTKTEVSNLSKEFYSLAEDILKLKKRKRPMTKAEVKGFRNQFLQLAVKLTIDILD